MAKIEEALLERKNMYGDFEDHARISQELKHLFEIQLEEKGKKLPPYQKEAVDMVFHKLARVVNGDNYYIDSWRDIVGYMQRVVEILERTEGSTDCTVTKFTVSGVKV